MNSDNRTFQADPTGRSGLVIMQGQRDALADRGASVLCEREKKPVEVAGARVMNVDYLGECQEQIRLSAELAQATRDLLEMQESQIAAIKLGDQRIGRFDEEITVALRVWKQARRAYTRDLQDHGCLDV